MKRFSVGFFLCLLIVFPFLLIGCNSGASDDLAGSATISSSNVVTLVGYVKDGSVSSFRPAAEMRCSLTSLAGIKVFLEKNSSLYGVTDANGKYVIQNVPQGVHTLVAEKREGTQVTFRARQENVTVSAPTGSTQVELSSQDTKQMISMQASPYSLTLFITDTSNRPLYRAKATIWGQDYYSDASGTVHLTDFPGIDTTAVISMVGYKTITVPVSFGDNYNSEIFVKLPQNTESNSAPIVSITYNPNSSAIFKFNNILYIRPNERVDLYAKGFDADNDYISYEWSAVGGGFTGNNTGSSVNFIATSTYKAVVILVGKDSKNGIGKAELELTIYGGSVPIATYTPTLATYTYHISTETVVIATDTPPIATETIIIATDTPPIATGTVIIATDTPPIATGTVIIATDTPPIATETVIIATDTPPIATGTVIIIATDTPPIATDTSIIATNTPDIGSDTQDIGSGTQDIGSGSQRI